MFGRSPGADSLTKEGCEFLYRPPVDGEESAPAHRVRRITRRQVKIENAAEDGTLADPMRGKEGTWRLSRQELEQRGYALHGTIMTRFYLSREAAEETGEPPKIN